MKFFQIFRRPWMSNWFKPSKWLEDLSFRKLTNYLSFFDWSSKILTSSHLKLAQVIKKTTFKNQIHAKIEQKSTSPSVRRVEAFKDPSLRRSSTIVKMWQHLFEKKAHNPWSLTKICLMKRETSVHSHHAQQILRWSSLTLRLLSLSDEILF